MSTEFFAPAAKLSQVPQTSSSEAQILAARRQAAAPAAPGNQLRILQRSLGNQAVQSLLKNSYLQAKLRVSEPGDIYEREADHVAETVMRMPEGAAAGAARADHQAPHIFRSVYPAAQAPEVSDELESSLLTQTSGGQPLPPSARGFFEPRFNADFSHVRIHTDSQAAESAKAVGARAFTLGNHIVFGDAEYAPDNADGRKLLAHELVHVVQQGGSARGVQRKPAVADIDATQAAAPVTNPPAQGSANTGNTVVTNWFVDFSGVANNGRSKGRGNRDPGDVLILEDFTVGPKNKGKTFAKAGDALKSGYSKLGAYDHPVGPGSAEGTVSYANRRELDVQLSWDGQKKNEKNPAALAAARKTVETLILHQSDVSGDWNEVERQAGEAASEHLPDDSHPKVEIKWRGNHQDYSLPTWDYEIRRPSLCTAIISVPTTSSAVDWSSSDTNTHATQNATHTADQNRLGTDTETADASAGSQSSSSLSANKDHEKDATDERHSRGTHTYSEYKVTLEDIENSSKYVSTTMLNGLHLSWAKIIKKLEEERGDKEVEHEEEKELGWGDRIKNWFVDHGKKAVDFVKNKIYGKVKGWVSGKIKSYIKKLIFVGVEAEAWWFPIVGWGVDWVVGKLGDKLRDKLSVHKGKDERDAQQPPPPNSNYLNSSTTAELLEAVREILTSSNTLTETERDIKTEFTEMYETDERSSSGKSHEHSKDSLAARANSVSSSDADATRTRVTTDTGHQESADNAVGDLTTTTRAYHGTTIRITAGQPLLTIKIQENP